VRFSIIATGDEVIDGRILNLNAAHLAGRVTAMGGDVRLHLAVGDQIEDIVKALRWAREVSDAIIITGGLGPTVDDITLEAVAKHLSLPLEFREDVWREIQERIACRGRKHTENDKRQAFMPAGAVPLKNRVGIASGAYIKKDGKEYFVLPGVPREMEVIFEEEVVPRIKGLRGRPRPERILRCLGAPEALLDERIRALKLEGVSISFRIALPEILIRVVPSGGLCDEVKLNEAVERIKGEIGEWVIGEGNFKVEELVGKMLKERGCLLSVAESCTGGLISSRITDVPGASRYFLGGVSVYSNEAKVKILGVDRKLIDAYGAVSREVALEMAVLVRCLFGSTHSIAVTGIAGPTGGSDAKPQGTVYIAVSDEETTTVERMFFPVERRLFKEFVASHAMNMLRKRLEAM